MVKKNHLLFVYLKHQFFCREYRKHAYLLHFQNTNQCHQSLELYLNPKKCRNFGCQKNFSQKEMYLTIHISKGTEN